MKIDEVLRQGIQLLQTNLSVVPWLKNADIQEKAFSEASWINEIDYSLPTANYQFVLTAKANGQPRFVREGVNELLVNQIGNPDQYGIVIAPFLSEASAKICEEANIGFLDLSGNCRLAYKNLFIQINGRSNQFAEKRDLISLYSPKSERILRTLLSHPYQPWRTVTLGQKAIVSIGLVSYVKKQLSDREWIQTSEDGFALIEPENLLKEWSNHYTYKKNEITECYTFSTLEDFEKDVREASFKNSNLTYALTGFSAAKYYAPMVTNQRIMVYLSEIPYSLIQQLNLKPVTSGANVSLFKPYDEGVFLNLNEVNHFFAVSPIQTYLDLINYRGRGEEAADTLYREVIQKQWAKQKIMLSKK